MPLEMKEGTIPIWGTKGLSTRPRCITLITTTATTTKKTRELAEVCVVISYVSLVSEMEKLLIPGK
jgi:hypothetical protein